jgi:hypothetical protein
MRRRAAADLEKTPQLTRLVIDYLLQLDNADEYLDHVLNLWNRREDNPERLIHFARYLCDASFSARMFQRISLIPMLQDLRERYGRPHQLVIDESFGRLPHVQCGPIHSKASYVEPRPVPRG